MTAPKTKAEKTTAEMSWVEPALGDAPGIPPTLLVLPAEITHAQAATCLHMLLTVVRGKSREPAAIEVDAAPLARFDSSALAVLLECRRAVLLAGKRFAVRGIPAQLAELARLYGVAQLLDSQASP